MIRDAAGNREKPPRRASQEAQTRGGGRRQAFATAERRNAGVVRDGGTEAPASEACHLPAASTLIFPP